MNDENEEPERCGLGREGRDEVTGIGMGLLAAADEGGKSLNELSAQYEPKQGHTSSLLIRTTHRSLPTRNPFALPLLIRHRLPPQARHRLELPERFLPFVLPAEFLHRA